MICPTCGASNDDTSLLCANCGSHLPHDEELARQSFEYALYRALLAEGTSVLREPNRFLGLVSDLCDHSSREYNVFEFNCSPELLQPFGDALAGAADAAALDDAQQRSLLVLADRFIEARYASSCVRCIRNACARFVGLPTLPFDDARQGPAGSTTSSPQAQRTGAGSAPRPPRESSGMATQPQTAHKASPQPGPAPAGRPSASAQVAPSPRRPSSLGLGVLVAALLVAVGVIAFALGSSHAATRSSSNAAAVQRPADDEEQGGGDEEKGGGDDKPKSESPSTDAGADSPDLDDSADATEPDPTPSVPSRPTFSNVWEGTYDGIGNDDGSLLLRQLIFDFWDVSDGGDLTGECYVGIYEDGRDDATGSFFVSGKVDWDTGDIHIWWTGWDYRNKLGPEREYRGTVDFANQTMSGQFSDLGADAFDLSWRCGATGSVNWRT